MVAEMTTATPPVPPPPRSPRAPQRWDWRAQPWRVAGAALLAAIALLVVFWNWNWFKGPVERAVEARTGRDFEIRGNLHVDLGRVTTITADGLRFANADWSTRGDMATTDRLLVRIESWPLLRGDVRLPEIRLVRPDLKFEANPKGGAGNWDFLASDSEPGASLRIGALWIEGGRVRYDDVPQKTAIDVHVGSGEPREPGGAPPIVVAGDGRWSGNAFTLEGTGESPLALQDATAPYRIDLRARAGATRAHARGTLVDPLRFRDFDLKFALSGQNLSQLYPLVGVALPDTPPYAIDGRLTRDGATWHYDGFTGKVGQSDLSGDVAFTTGSERPKLVATLASKRLDFDDLAGFIGGTPDAEGEALDPELAAREAKLDAAGKVLPTATYDLSKLRSMDADVRLRAQHINAPKLPIDDMDAHLLLDAGLLRLEPLNFGVAGGDIRSTVRMDARKDVIDTRLLAEVRRLELSRLFPDVELTKDAAGRLAGRFNIAGQGNSIAAMLGTADGDIAVGMGRGEISNLLVELAGLDVYEAVKYLIGKDRKVAVRCAFADFGVKRGVMQSRALAFDTADTIIVGEGSVDLGEESMDLTLKPRPKDRSILALRTPLYIGGTFADPSFRPDFARLGLRGTAAVALATIAPPAALLATLELGPGEDSDCGGSYAR